MRTSSCLIIAATALAAAARPDRARAQYPIGTPEPPREENFTNLGSYAIAVPIGDTRRFTNGMSWLGIGWEGQWRVRSRTVAGASLTLNHFYDETRGTTNFGTGSVTGFQHRDLLLAGAMATGRWYLDRMAGHGPYIGLGAGGQWAQQYYQLGVNSQLSRSAFHLALAPEFGVAKQVMDGIDLMIGLRYTASAAAGDYVGGGARKFNFLSLSFALAEH
jgi:opacity protein-like surface antigen